MKLSARGKRHARHQRKAKTAGLNLVSLMDIFTILVFFLLINSGDVEILQSDDSLELPASSSDRPPEETLLLVVNREAIVVGGRELVKLDALELTESGEIVALSEELQYLAARKTTLTEREEEEGLAITVMGDKDTPYSLLKKVIQTCAAHNYRDIALAVSQIQGADVDPESVLSGDQLPESSAINQSTGQSASQSANQSANQSALER